MADLKIHRYFSNLCQVSADLWLEILSLLVLAFFGFKLLLQILLLVIEHQINDKWIENLTPKQIRLSNLWDLSALQRMYDTMFESWFEVVGLFVIFKPTQIGTWAIGTYLMHMETKDCPKSIFKITRMKINQHNREK